MAEKLKYRYYTTDLITNTVLAEIPLQSVNWSRALRRAGNLDGKIPVIGQTRHLDLYNSTMPARTGLYVVRNGRCVWGGIIWSRTYTPQDRELSISASEFTSYLYHRFVWKSLLEDVIGTKVDPIQIGSYSVTSGVATFSTRNVNLGSGSTVRPHNLSVGDQIYVRNLPGTASVLNGGYTVYGVPNSYEFTVLSDADNMSGTTSSATFRRSIENYKFVRDLIGRVTNDFAGINITQDDFHPGLQRILGVVAKQRFDNTARLTLSEVHNLIEGQEVVVKDVTPTYDGRVTVTGITSGNSFEYANIGKMRLLLLKPRFVLLICHHSRLLMV